MLVPAAARALLTCRLLTPWDCAVPLRRLLLLLTQLPDRFKSGPLSNLLSELTLLYYALYQGVEGARRTYFRQVRRIAKRLDQNHQRPIVHEASQHQGA